MGFESTRSSNVTFPTDREAKRQFLLSAVDQIRDLVIDTADEAEKSRTLPSALFDAMYETGLFWMKLPEVLGGAEADPQFAGHDLRQGGLAQSGWAMEEDVVQGFAAGARQMSFPMPDTSHGKCSPEI